MINCSSDELGQILTISYSHRVEASQMDECLAEIRDRMGHLQPGFALLSDLTSLEWMDPSCAPALGEIMELLSVKGMAIVVRVIPDPDKDIGFNLISHFHYQRPVRVHTCANLADGMKCLVAELPSATAAA